jgi:hypothetical protein
MTLDAETSQEIRPFRTDVPQADLDDLHDHGMIQSTRPQTLGYGLTDSPAGQLGWIVEKFTEWTDSTDRPEQAVDRDQMLTNVMLYWLTGTATSSARIYYRSRTCSSRTSANSSSGYGDPSV